jgi:hypothetical protein
VSSGALPRPRAWLCALVLAAAFGQPAGAVETAPNLPTCEVITVALVDSVDSSRAVAGERFRFQTIADIPAGPSHPALPQGTIGYGLVMGAHHSQRGGRPGHLLVDTRFFQLADGTRVEATFIPRSRYDSEVMDGWSADAPGYIGMIPFASVMTGAYNTLHYGREIIFATGTKFSVLLGDDLALGKCHLAPEVAPKADPKATAAPTAAATGTPEPGVSPTPPAAPSPVPAATKG